MGQTTPPPTADQSCAARKGPVQPGSGLCSQAEKAAKAPVDQPVVAVTDEERASLTFTAYDLDVHLTPAQSQLAVHAGFTVKNSGNGAVDEAHLSDLVFSALGELCDAQATGKFLRCRSRCRPSIRMRTIPGKATEAVVSLPQPLLPGASLEL